MSDVETRLSPGLDPKATVTGLFAATDFAPGDLIADRFRVVRLLGMGAMGVVYQAEDTQLNVPVALKLLRPELASKPEAFDRFRHELLLARQVSSPHVVRIHDLVQHQGAWLISMDFVAGESLEDLLAREKRLSPDRALQITRQLALGLAAAHNKGVVHRDLKPANVLLNEQGDALISDFGVARSMGATRLTQSGMVVGTPAYLSPEQAQAAPIDGRSDLYTLGLMLYEMLSGELPFGQGTGSEMLVQRILRSAPSVRTQAPQTPHWIADLLSALLLPNRDDRIATAEELVKAIDRKLPPSGRKHRQQLRRLRTWIPLSVTALSLLVAAFAIGLLWKDTREAAGDRIEVAILPFGDGTMDDETRALLRGAEILLAASLAEHHVVAEPDQSRRTIAQLGLDESTWRRNRERVLAAIPAAAWISLDPAGDGRWQWRMSRQDGIEPVVLGSFDASDKSLATGMAPMIRSVASRLGSGSRQTGPDIDTITDDDLRLLALPAQPESVTPARSRPAFALWCHEELDRLERTGDRALAQVAARTCLDGLGPDQPDMPQWTIRAKVHALLALEQADAASPLASRLLDHTGPSIHLRARVAAETGDLSGAETMMTSLTARDPGDGRAWFQAGKFAIQRGDAQRAVDDYLVRAQVLANRQDDALLRADVANALGVGFRRLGQLSAAAEHYRTAVALHERAGNARGHATSLHNLASVLSTLGQFDDAEATLTQAEVLIRPLGDTKSLADLRVDFGVLAEERGDFPAALSAYREALNLHLQGADPLAIAESLLNVGFAYYQMGDFVNAEVHWQQADERSRSVGDLFGTVRAQLNLGLAHAAKGDFARARDSFEASLTAAESNQMGEERAVAEAALAEQDRLEGRLGSARERALRALGMFEGRQNPRGITEMRLLLATIALARHDRMDARLHLDGLGADLPNKEQAALWHLRWAQLERLEGNLPRARKAAESAVTLAHESHSMQIGVEAELLMAELVPRHEATGWLKRASDDLAGFASLPLQVQLHATRMALDEPDCAIDFRQGSAFLSRTPGFVGAPGFLQAATMCSDLPADTRAESRGRARSSATMLVSTLPEGDRAGLERWIEALDGTP